MKHKILPLFIFLIFISLTACKKDQEIKSQTDNNKFDFKKIITLNPDRSISKIQQFKGADLEYSKVYVYSTNIVTIIFNRPDTIRGKSTFYLKEGIATHSSDTFYNTGNIISIYNKIYVYNQDNKLIEIKTQNMEKSGDSIREVSNNYITTYTYKEENKVNIEKGPYKCRDELVYNDITPEVNINDFESYLKGTNRNLIKSGYYNLGCPAWASYNYLNNEFSYSLNDENYVTRQEEKSYGGSSGTPPPGYKPKPEITITVYEYIKL